MSCAAIEKRPTQQVGRYTICDQLAAGGMATVHLARLVGSAGFSRVVAAKRMHQHFLADPEFKKMFLAEAQLAARVQHPNVVPILDVLSLDDELILFMDYVHGEALHTLMRAAPNDQDPIPTQIGSSVIAGALQGLHAAHEARNELGEPLGIVHRDVSPQNILVGADGVARVLDFGIAKALHAQHHTDPGTVKGKFSYMAPEVINGGAVTRQTDIFSAGVILWELLTGKKLFGGASERERLLAIISGSYPSPRQFNARVSAALESVVARALQVDPKSRFATALEFAIAIEVAAPMASQHVVGEWVRRIAASTLDGRMARIHEIETSVVTLPDRLSLPPQQSLTVPAKLGNSRPSIVTTVGTPSAKRRSNRRRALVTVVSIALTAALGIGYSLLRARGSPDRQSTLASNALPITMSAAVVAPVTSAALETAIPNTATPTIVSPPLEKGPSHIVETPPPRKPSATRATNLPRTRTRSTTNAKQYLPSEL